MRVNGSFGGGDGAEALLARHGVDAVESRFAAAHEEGSDADGYVVYNLSLGTGCVAEISGSFSSSSKTVAAGRAG